MPEKEPERTTGRLPPAAAAVATAAITAGAAPAVPTPTSIFPAFSPGPLFLQYHQQTIPPMAMGFVPGCPTYTGRNVARPQPESPTPPGTPMCAVPMCGRCGHAGYMTTICHAPARFNGSVLILANLPTGLVTNPHCYQKQTQRNAATHIQQGGYNQQQPPRQQRGYTEQLRPTTHMPQTSRCNSFMPPPHWFLPQQSHLNSAWQEDMASSMTNGGLGVDARSWQGSDGNGVDGSAGEFSVDGGSQQQ